ncbi:MAG: hypothetical protein FWD79_10685 [Desulfobulbus sp.]|nr:hypothetical protein [Desulfobulbus sp.]
MNTSTLQNLLEGFRDNFFVLSEAQYRRPERGGFRKDAKALSGDAAKVASITRKKADEAYDKQRNATTG